MEALYRRQQSRVHGVCPRQGDIPSSAVSPVPDTGILLLPARNRRMLHDVETSSPDRGESDGYRRSEQKVGNLDLLPMLPLVAAKSPWF